MVFYITIWIIVVYGFSAVEERATEAASALQAAEQQAVSEQAVLESQAYTLLAELPGEMSAEALQQIVLNNSNSYGLQVIRLETLKEKRNTSKRATNTSKAEVDTSKGESDALKDESHTSPSEGDTSKGEGNTSSVVVELRGDLKEYLLFADNLRRQYPLLQIKPQSLNRKNGQVHIVCILTA